MSAPSQDEPVQQNADIPAPVERAVIAAALAGDEGAFETLIRAYGRRVYAVAFAVVQDAAEAEDIVQETFLKVHQRRTRDADRFAAWLMTVTRNAARDRLRRRKPQAPEETFHTLPDEAASPPGAEMQRREYQARLGRALGTLRRMPALAEDRP